MDSPISSMIEYSIQMALNDPLFRVPNSMESENCDSPKADQNLQEESSKNLKDSSSEVTQLKSSATSSGSKTVASEVQYTKKGEIRKRKKYETSIQERKKEKLEKEKEKHKLRPGCNDCNRKCKEFTSNHRLSINTQYWKMTWTERRLFIALNVSMHDVKTKRGRSERDRKRTFKYFLKNQTGEKHQVCKYFFLTTLGYDPKNDRIIKNVLTKQDPSIILPESDKRGKHPKASKRDREVIKSHFESFSLTLLHYCGKDSLKKGCLPSDITIRQMHNHFMTMHPEVKCSYELYRRCVSKDFNVFRSIKPKK